MNKSKKILLLTTALLFATILFSTIYASNIITDILEIGITTDALNLRSKPEISSASYIKTVPENTKIQLHGKINDFYIVQTENDEVGLMNENYISKCEELTDNTNYTKIEPYYALVIDDYTIVRGGPSTNYPKYTMLNSNEKVQVIGKINDFLLVITSNDTVGMIREDLLKKIDTNIQDENDNTNNDVTSNNLLNIINEKRQEKDVCPLILDDTLSTLAQQKAKDMKENNYFSHDSPTYGTAFDMLNNNGIYYYTAGENIAHNTNASDTIDSFLNEEHSINLLTNSYNYVGIGIEKSDEYGYIIVLIFIGK